MSLTSEMDAAPGDTGSAMSIVPALDTRPLSIWRGIVNRPTGGAGVAVTPEVRDAIVIEVAEKYGVGTRAIMAGSKCRGAVGAARHEVMWRLREIRTPDGKHKHSLPLIARSLGMKNHTSIIHGVRKHEERMGQ